MTAIRLRTSRGSSTASWPSTVTRPEVGINWVEVIRMKVVLPAPLRPISP